MNLFCWNLFTLFFTFRIYNAISIFSFFEKFKHHQFYFDIFDIKPQDRPLNDWNATIPCPSSSIGGFAPNVYLNMIFVFNVPKATSMKVIRRNEETNDIDEKSPFLERSIPVTRSPKVSGAGVQLSRVLKIYANIFEISPSLSFIKKSGQIATFSWYHNIFIPENSWNSREISANFEFFKFLVKNGHFLDDFGTRW